MRLWCKIVLLIQQSGSYAYLFKCEKTHDWTWITFQFELKLKPLKIAATATTATAAVPICFNGNSLFIDNYHWIVAHKRIRKTREPSGTLIFHIVVLFIARMFSFDYNHVLWNNDDQLTTEMAFQLTDLALSLARRAPPSSLFTKCPFDTKSIKCSMHLSCVLAFKQIFWLIAKHFSPADRPIDRACVRCAAHFSHQCCYFLFQKNYTIRTNEVSTLSIRYLETKSYTFKHGCNGSNQNIQNIY